MKESYDIIVVGGGHAGIEAAWAASVLGAETALVTMQRNAIGRLSCNPAIGGLGKGQMVREIDALGGLMGLASDAAGIQFRLLNRSKGPAVRAPRAQMDRHLYPSAVQSLLANASRLEIVEGSVESIDALTRRGGNDRARVRAVTLADGRVLRTAAVILTTGTFLRGLMHTGADKTAGGRVGEHASQGLARSLQSLGLEMGRLKTGTPPRVHRDSINYDVCERQKADEVAAPFSWMTDRITQPQIDCWITWTSPGAHDLIRDNLHRAPMYSGQIESTGPRYCPSIEDKVVRFADKARHQLFLEPEGYDDERVYCNGISTSLPKDVQEGMMRHIAGLEHAKIIQHGYAVEYDFVPTHQTLSSLESKLVDGLYLAGQINGTSGYEEAASQGLMAGVNAARKLREEEPFILGRDQAYIGVMIDDLITRPPIEPYRMFTSRAEYRLLLRADNADQRLSPIGRELGLVDDKRWHRFVENRDAMAAVRALCDTGKTQGVALRGWIRQHDTDVAALGSALTDLTDTRFGQEVLAQVLVDAKYEGYVERQAQQIERFKRLESMAIPRDIDYRVITGLRAEAREHLDRVEPRNLGQAGRLSGISPADLTVLWIHLKGNKRNRRTNTPEN